MDGPPEASRTRSDEDRETADERRPADERDQTPDRDRRVEALEARLADAESRLDDLAAATQALRGYVGGVRAVNREVERRADAALAAVERLDGPKRERPVGGQRPQGEPAESGTSQSPDVGASAGESSHAEATSAEVAAAVATDDRPDCDPRIDRDDDPYPDRETRSDPDDTRHDRAPRTDPDPDAHPDGLAARLWDAL